MRSLLGRAPVEREVDDELAFHLEMRARELMAGGMNPAAAREEARRRFGAVDDVRKECLVLGRQREKGARRVEYLAEALQDVRFALRQLARSPGFALVAVLTLALGIGPTTAIFSAVEAVVLRRFDFAHPDRTFLVSERWRDQDGGVSAGNYVDWQQRGTGFEQLAAVHWDSFNLAEADLPERVLGARVTWNYFAAFGARPLLGRTFDAAEDQPGRADVVVLGQRLWARRFASDPGILGRQIRLSGRPHTVLGILPSAFDPLLGGEQLWGAGGLHPGAQEHARRALPDGGGSPEVRPDPGARAGRDGRGRAGARARVPAGQPGPRHPPPARVGRDHRRQP